MKYSIIVPVYNTEKYIKKCIDSLINQTYDNFEIIIVDDETPDSAIKIVEQFKDKRIKIFHKKNGGLSDSRNFGISKSTGDYIIFIDSDDYVSLDLLKIIDREVNKEKPDLIKFSFAYDTNGVIENISTISYKGNGLKAFTKLVENKTTFEMAWLYVYKKSFWKNNTFNFTVGKYHEDFGLTPLVILKAKKVCIINDVLYYYVQRENSIMSAVDKKKLDKKVNDTLYYYDLLKQQFEEINIKDKEVKKYFYSYISNALIKKVKELDEKNLLKFIEELKKRKVFDNLIDDTLIRKIKKNLLKLYPKLFIKFM